MLHSKNSPFRLSAVLLAAALGMTTTACSDDDDKEEEPDVVADAADGGVDDGGTDDGGMDDTGGEDATAPETIAAIVSGNENFSTLLAAVEAAGLTGALADEAATLTVFAPTNAAFDQLPDGTLQTLLDDPEGDLTTILQLHLLNTEVLAAAIPAGETFIETLGGRRILVTNNGAVTVGGATVSEVDLTATNGVIHVLDDVILPQNSVIDVAANTAGEFETLEVAVTTAGLSATLQNFDAVTVFAPTDAAFSLVPSDVLSGLLDDIDALTSVLQLHVVEGTIPSSDIAAGETTVTTIGGQSLVITNTDGIITVNNATVITPDVQADNGVIHVVDAVIVEAPVGTNTIVDVLANDADGRFTTLITLAGSIEGLVGILQAAGPYTLFAPTNAAFEGVDAELLAALQADVELLGGVLQYHAIIGEALLAEDVLGSSLLGMANGIFAKIDADAGTIQGAVISETNLTADNGVVHVLDNVMIPPANIPTLATELGFSTLVGAVVAADLAETLSGAGPFTVLAPTNEAFEGLSLPTDITVVADILLYHVISSGAFDAAAVAGLTEATMANGDTVTIEVDGDGGITVNGINVIIADVPASNGIIHAIDGVLLPPTTTIIDVIANDEDGRFSTLITLAGSVDGLVALLQEDRPYTLFAPTNAAFELVDPATLAALGADNELLAGVLQYHAVIGAALTAEDVLGSATLGMANGILASIDADAGTIQAAVIAETNLTADNGIVHVLDNVMIPPGDIPTVATELGFSTLVGAVVDTGLAETLSGAGPFTVLAPTNGAFEGVTLPGDLGVLADILLYHVIDTGAFDSIAVAGLTEVVMANGDTVAIAVGLDGGITVNGISVLIPNVTTSNGIIHAIDGVLLPPTLP
ncbi:MAG: transforming growth factor-beta-induced protein [Bradymonadia bacterium]|jgi:transforming growth factor-beta-induced protein